MALFLASLSSRLSTLGPLRGSATQPTRLANRPNDYVFCLENGTVSTILDILDCKRLYMRSG